ncbi:hypothetical protein GW756_02455 [bacterium]|nr:hypothetical protein [bacterium]NCQ55655.1 hypothetical protein [Candidatus Parcubacteria bacterium]NCS67480.1 hypothetical protein [Candidatus Peregrinibacteria bacterium]NCS96206.1 hypothetical protein [bacterium]
MRWGFRAFLEEDENVLRVFRRPILFSIPGFTIRALLWLGLVAAVWFFYPAYNQFNVSYIWQGLAVVGFVHTFAPMWKWYFNSLVMTNESLIIVDWPKLWERRSTRIDFHNLDEITVERNGVKSFMLNYGNLILGKINGGEMHSVKGIGRPTKTARIIEDYREWFLDKKNFTEESALKGLLSGLVQRHVGETGQPMREQRGSRYETTFDPNVLEVALQRSTPSSARSHPATAPQETRKKEFHKKNYDNMPDMEVEKDLDDTGGIDIDLDD